MAIRRNVMYNNTPRGITPEELSMSYSDLIPKGRDLRLFNGRGAISVWNQTVTGLQALRFPPFCLDDYRFSLAFRDRSRGLLIQDIMADMADYMNRTGGPDGRGPHPLSTNWQIFIPDEKTGFCVTNYHHQTLVFQDGSWQPAQMIRKGHYHKRFDGKLTSFSIETIATVSAEKDEFFMQIKLANRTDSELVLDILPVQNIVDAFKLNAYQDVERPDSFTVIYKAPDEKKMYFSVSADAENIAEGWQIALPAADIATINFSVKFGFEPQESTPYDTEIAARIALANRAVCDRLAKASLHLPKIKTDNAFFDSFYKKSLLTVVESTWHRNDYIIDPFYACGTWMYTLAWDTSFSSKLLALTDPIGLCKTIELYVESDLMHHTYLHCLGGAAEKPYIQTLFAAVKILEDYISITRDRDILHKQLKNGILLDSLKLAFKQLLDRFLANDGLLDFGEVSDEILEIRTDGYRNKVSGVNGIAALSLAIVAKWCKERGDADADELLEKARTIGKQMDEKMWSDKDGWFACLYPNEESQMIFSYHLFDFFTSPFLTKKHRDAMSKHICKEEFLGKYGMYSISKKDLLHFDYDDADWGGGGQYIGMPGRIAETLYLADYGDAAWEILSRCIKWSEGYPYFPQEIHTDSLTNPDYEMPIEISAGAGIQAILFGVFGIRPQDDGSLQILPCYTKELGTATLEGFHFGHRVYNIKLFEDRYEVSCDDGLYKSFAYCETAVFKN